MVYIGGGGGGGDGGDGGGKALMLQWPAVVIHDLKASSVAKHNSFYPPGISQ